MQNVQGCSSKTQWIDQTYQECKNSNQFKLILNEFIHLKHHKQWNHQLRVTEILLYQQLTIMYDGNLLQEYCILHPNVLSIGIHNIQLSQYQIKQKSFLFNNKICYLIALGDDILLLFKDEELQQQWYYSMKQFSIMKFFQRKFQLEQELFQGFYKIINKKNNEQFSANIICKQQPYLEHTFGLLHECRHPSILKIKGIYEDPSNYIIVTDYYEGEPIFNALIRGQQLQEFEIASLMYQILILLRYLNDHQAYHGNLGAHSVIINQDTITIDIIMIDFVYFPFKQGDDTKQYWNWVSQFQQKRNMDSEIPGIHSDLYQLGILLYMITFFPKDVNRMENKIENKKFYFQYMKDLHIDYDLINQSIEILAGLQIKQKLELKTLNENYKHVFSLSQLHLIKKLLSQCSLTDALNHQWFINTQQKCKSHHQRQGITNLKTIIEQREFSDEEYSISQNKQNNIQSENCESIDEYPTLQYLMRNILDYEKAPCKSHHC